jgi:prepilin-type N-terminal cleavage/methylation domain-containing protein
MQIGIFYAISRLNVPARLDAGAATGDTFGGILMRNKGFTLIELLIVVIIMGILVLIAIPNFMSMMRRGKEATVKSNCHTVQLAVEDWAIQSGGLYPVTVDGDATPAGETVLDILPSGVPLENPFTRLASEPVNGAAATPGQTGYLVIPDANGMNTGYTITGFGQQVQILTLQNGQ